MKLTLSVGCLKICKLMSVIQGNLKKNISKNDDDILFSLHYSSIGIPVGPDCCEKCNWFCVGLACI